MEVSIGIVGIRGYGSKFLEMLSEGQRQRVTACLHPDKDVVSKFSSSYGMKSYTDEKDFFCSNSFNAVLLMIPNHLHYSYGKLALLSGKHVFIEKPLANTLKEAEELNNLATQNGLVLMVGHNYRKSGFIERIKAELDNKSIGNLVAAEFNMGHGGGLKFGPDKWRFHKDKCPGGPLNMLGSHLIDASNYLFGRVKNTNGIVKNLHARTTAEDMSMIQLEYESGVVVNIVNLYNSVSTEYINIYGTDGAIRYQRWPVEGLWLQPKDVNCDSAKYLRLDFENNTTQRVVFDEFINLISENNFKESNVYSSVEVVRIMEEVRGY